MQQHSRYEVMGLIGNGDFASVYHARDRELGRDVAIKQIHSQYMSDQKKLERFWREAQLMATLSHPHVMTIYDIVRPRGWLVLELMQGTLLDASKGQPIDLNQLRAALVGSLSALSMLHGSQVIHGDIKPSNLMLDRMGRIKLGDFGLARRVANDQGSYLKGATRYMAPELVGAQFGPVGPASDLYSLGFTAYELLCGPQEFENLFPGLEAFGRDRQIAWMMWHAAPDRRLPPVGSVLDGVPSDLARVIDKLTAKDQSQRYKTAEQALADLGDAPAVVRGPSDEEQNAAAAKKQKFLRRMVAGLALCASLLVSVLITVVPTGKKADAPATEPVAVRGMVRMLVPERQTMIVEQTGGRGPKEIVVRGDDKVYLNDRASLLRELRENDQVAIQTLRDEQGRLVMEVQASRPQEDRGTIAEIQADDGELTIALAGADQELKLVVGEQTAVELNGSGKLDGRALTLADLLVGDRVTSVHFRDQDRQTALKIAAMRVVEGEGVVRAIDLKKREVSIAAEAVEGAVVTVWPVDEKVEVSLNGRRLLNNRLLTQADVKPGDRVKYSRDVKIVSIAAQRQFTASGAMRAIRYDVRSFTAEAAKGGAEKTFVLAPQCEVSLGGKEVSFDELRRGDQFEVEFDEPDAVSPAVTSISAVRPADRGKWAVLISGSSFDDASVASLPAAAVEIATLKQALAERYAVPLDQAIVLADPSRIRLSQGLQEALAKVGQAKQLIVVVAGRAIMGSQSAPLIAPKDFERARPDVTGVSLASLLVEVDRCVAAEKYVVLELAAADGSVPLPATAALVDSIRGTRSRPLLKSTPIIASDVTGVARESKLPARLTAAVTGAADPNRDNQVTLVVLHDYLKSEGGGIRLIVPDTTPPRLSDDAKTAIRRLAATVLKQRTEKSEVQSLLNAAEQLAPKQPEPKLVGAIALVKAKEINEALGLLGNVVVDHPKTSLAWELSAWIRFDQLKFASGMNDLVQLVQNLPKERLSEVDRRAILLAGRLREFAAGIEHAADRRVPPAAVKALDTAVQARGPEIMALFEQGRAAAGAVIADFNRKMEMAPDSSEQLRIKYDRQQLRHYVNYPLDSAAQQAIAMLEVE